MVRFKQSGVVGLRAAVSALIVGVADVVDTNPEREQRVDTGPRSIHGFARDGGQKLIHLVCQGQHRRRVRRNEGRVDRRAAVGVVVREDERLVILDGVDVDPIGSANCSEPLRPAITSVKTMRRRI